MLREGSQILISRQLFETLVTFDPQTFALRPGLADSWDVLDGGTRFRFHFRPGARFHNDREVTAEDARYSLNRLVQEEIDSEGARLLQAVAGFERVVLAGGGELDGVVAVDRSTLEIRLSFPWLDFPYVLTHPSTATLPRAELEANQAGFSERPVGSGPYELVEPVRLGDQITARWSAAYGGAEPSVREIRFQAYPDAESAWRDFERGRLEIAETPPGRTFLGQAKYGDAGFSPRASAIYLGFNLKNRKLAEPRLRLALSYLIDRREIAGAIYGGHAVAATGIVPPGVAGGGAGDCAACELDMARGRRLIREAYPNRPLPQIAYDYPEGDVEEAIGQSIRGALRQAGVDLRLRPHNSEDFLELLKSGGHETFPLIRSGQYPLADSFLNPLFHSASPDNYAAYASSEIDELLSRGRLLPEQDMRLNLFREIERRLLGDLPMIPVAFFRNSYVADPRVEGFYVDSLGAFDVSRFKIDAP